MLKNTIENYGVVAKSFHMVIALLIIGLLAVGLYMADMDASPVKFKIYGIHKALGIIVLALAALRVIWRGINVKPAPLPSHRPWEKILAGIAHILLYAAMFIMPLSGWIMSSAGGHPVSMFGLFTLPAIVAENKELGKIAREIHGLSGNLLIGLIALHVAGALKHYVIDKDNTLARMFGRLFERKA